MFFRLEIPMTDAAPRLVKTAKAEKATETPIPTPVKTFTCSKNDLNILKASVVERQTYQDAKDAQRELEFVVGGEQPLFGIPVRWDRYTVLVQTAAGTHYLLYKIAIRLVGGVIRAENQ